MPPMIPPLKIESETNLVKMSFTPSTAKLHVIIHGCNAQGVMGSGVALTIKEDFPSAFSAYRHEYVMYGLVVGDMIPAVVIDKGNVLDGKDHNWFSYQPAIPDDVTVVVANCVTQHHYGRDKNIRYVDYDGMEQSFRTLTAYIETFIDDNPGMSAHDVVIHYPAIGCGLANGDWGVVHPIIQQQFEQFNLHYHIFKG